MGMEFGQSREYSEATAAVIDEEVRLILQNAYQQALDVLSENKEKLEGLAKLLMEKETVNHQEFLAFMNGEEAVEAEGTVEDAPAVEEE